MAAVTAHVVQQEIVGPTGPGDLVKTAAFSTCEGAGDRTRTGDVQLGKLVRVFS
jgi:hypothetical protein